MIVVDTNLIVYFFKREPAASAFLKQQKFDLYVSSLSVVELFSYRKLTRVKQRSINAWLDVISIVEVDRTIATVAADLRRAHPSLKLVDSVIAATALEKGVPLASRDKDFRKIRELELIVP